MDNTRKTAAWAAGIAGAMTLLAGLGALRGADLAASDALYQSRSGSDGEIALVCIDQRALEELGPYSEWDRDIFAQVLEALNASEDCRPAAIGLTVPLPDETGADTDQWLAQAAEEFADRIVLIGFYAAGTQDSYVTAADHAGPMYGVEFQANAIQALLWESYKREVGDGPQLAVLFLLLLAAFAGFWRRKLWSSTLLWAALAGGWVLLCRLACGQGFILHVLWVPVCVSILYVGCIAANYLRAAMERREVTRRFKRYVAPEIVSEILREGTESLSLGGKMTQIAVLFVDVRDFTSMSERLAGHPEQVVAILNRYLTLVADCIVKNKGTLDKFVGDAAMAFWGAPLPQDDFVMHAVRAASDMVKGSKQLAEELERDFGQSVSFGIGVHLGDAVVGNMGSEARMDYTAIGDTVNTAARLEANAPSGTIYISRAVADALEGRIRATPLPAPIKLKGKKDGFEILTLDEILDEP